MSFVSVQDNAAYLLRCKRSEPPGANTPSEITTPREHSFKMRAGRTQHASTLDSRRQGKKALIGSKKVTASAIAKKRTKSYRFQLRLVLLMRGLDLSSHHSFLWHRYGREGNKGTGGNTVLRML